MTFVVCDEGLFTKGKNRLAKIPEGKGICALYALTEGFIDFGVDYDQTLSVESV